MLRLLLLGFAGIDEGWQEALEQRASRLINSLDVINSLDAELRLRHFGGRGVGFGECSVFDGLSDFDFHGGYF